MIFNPARSFYLVLLVLALLFGRAVMASELDYPELNVTPRASERIQLEADKEYQRGWLNVAPIQFSALITLGAAAAFIEKSDTNSNTINPASGQPNPSTPSYAKTIGLGVGATWLLATLAFDMWYRPYESGLREISPMPRKTQREQLTRERMAEGALESAATMGRRLMWMSTITNLFASVYMLANSEKGTTGVALAAAALPAALTPLLFQTQWQSVAAEQREYKKKIYGPVSSLTVQPTVLSDARGSLAPGMILSLSF